MVKFWKISATGNDFIIINNLNGEHHFSSDFVEKLCARRTGVGADGLIYLNKSEKYDFKMTYLNADGGEVAMCGNGTRALSYFYHQTQNPGKTKFQFETLNGIYKSVIQNNYVKVQMTERYDEGKIDVSGFNISDFNFYMNTGVPHCVFKVENLKNYPVFDKGRSIRYDSRFENGVNSNFFEEVEGIINIRTYERGVEDETLACGTGVTAVALSLYMNGDKRDVYSCRCGGGDVSIEVNSLDEVYLCGEVQKIYEGQLSI